MSATTSAAPEASAGVKPLADLAGVGHVDLAGQWDHDRRAVSRRRGLRISHGGHSLDQEPRSREVL
jgi:hypothetical protein